MVSNGREPDEDATLFISPERILRNCRSILVTSSMAIPVKNSSTVFQPLEAALEEAAASTPRAYGADSSDALRDTLVSKERPVLSIWLTRYGSSARPQDTMCDQVAAITVLAKDAVVRFSSGTGRATETSPKAGVIAVVRPVVRQSVAKPCKAPPSR